MDTKAPVTPNWFLEVLTLTRHNWKVGYDRERTINFCQIIPEARILPNLFLERLTPVNKIKKRTAVGVG